MGMVRAINVIAYLARFTEFVFFYFIKPRNKLLLPFVKCL